MSIKHLLRATKLKDDEYYTPYDTVRFVFEECLKNVNFKDKTIYCFCDSEESNFVKYLKANQLKMGFKELWYTWDDYNNHEDLFEKADYVITNPPFSKIVHDLKPLIHKTKKFLLFGTTQNLLSYYHHFIDIQGFRLLRIIGYYNFGRERNVQISFITNIEEAVGNRKKEFLKNEYKNLKDNVYGDVILIDGTKIKNVLTLDRMKDIPIDYQDFMLVPSTVLFEHYFYLFDLYYDTVKQGIVYKDFIKDKDHANIYSDGKSRFIRILVKVKEKYLKKENGIEEER